MKAHLDASGEPDVGQRRRSCPTSRSTRRRGSTRRAAAARARSRPSPPTRRERAPGVRRAGLGPLAAGRFDQPRGLPDGAHPGVEGSNQLVYVVDVTNGSSIRDLVFVNAHVGKLVNRYSLVHDALFRRLFERNIPADQIWQEGVDCRASNVDQQNIVNFSGDSYRFFFNTWAATRTTAPARRCGRQQRPDDRLPERELERHHDELLQRRHVGRRRSRTSGATRTRSTRTTSSTSGSRARSTSRTRTSGARSST